ncbi:MAG: T9SS type A sorting domain-containing protein, partial [Bacteroidetes bacterium]|nr:T9SS type A sorting domain-containing protein [Bacteroidota bacterium]
RSSGTYYNPVVFRNNGTDIRILPKITKKESQACRIKHCKFSAEWALYDSRYSTYTAGNYSQGVNPFIQHANPYCRTNFGVLLDNVTRTDIDSCTFRNLQTGIESHNSRHNVEGCDFRRLFTGIRIENATPNVNNYHHILANTFDSIPFTGQKGTAVYIRNGRYDMVIANTFGIFIPGGTQDVNNVGISVTNSGGYKIADNDLNLLKTGVILNNSGKAGGFVGPLNRKDGNKFRGCKRDVATSGFNKRLELRCNWCENNSPTPYIDHWYNYGSLADQGKWPPVPQSDPTYDRYAAGNEFRPPLRQDVKSVLTNPYNYYHHSDWFTTPNPAGTSVDTISINTQKTLTSCDPVLTIGNGSGVGVSVLRNQLVALDEEKDSLEVVYDNIEANLDNGSTDILANAILSGMPNGQLKNLLLQNSPLSDDVLILLLTEDPLSPGNLKNVLQLNLPVSKVVEPVFREELSSLPPGIANQLAALQKRNPGVITLQAIARQIEYVETQRQYVMQLLIEALVENGLEDEAIDLLEEEATDDAIQALTATYIYKNDPLEAELWLSELVPENQEMLDWIDINMLLIGLLEDGKTVYEIDSTQEQYLRNLADDCPESQAVTLAQSVLRLVSGDEFSECSPDPGGAKSLLFSDVVLPADEEIYLGGNYPNPFSSKTNILYWLPEGKEGVIHIYNASGEKIKTCRVKSGDSILEVETSNWASGVYSYTITSNNKILQRRKMVLVR